MRSLVKKLVKQRVNKLTMTVVKQLLMTVLTSALLLTSTAYAHDASKHKKKDAEKPKCELMKNMSQSEADKNDPVMQAMMKQCMAANEQHTMDIETQEHEGMQKGNGGGREEKGEQH